MYRFFLYVILIFCYLGISKALSPSELGVQYLQNEKSFTKLIQGSQVTTILIDTHATGFLFKTYYQKYRIIHGLNNVEEMILRTSKEFARKNAKNIGMSLYRRIDGVEEFLPLPPGSMYIGNREFGYWKIRKSGKKHWRFYHLYRHLPSYLGWGKFRPDEEFYQKMRSYQTMDMPYFGLNEEFGANGSVTRKNFPHFFSSERKKRIDIKTLLVEYLKDNF